MSRILVTNFHPRGGGGHVPYIMSLISNFNDDKNIVGVVAPEQSQIYRFLSDTSYPGLYKCDFPAFTPRNFSQDLASIRDFRAIVADFKPDIVHTNGGDLYTVLWSYPLGRPFKVVRTHHAVRKIKNSFYHRLIYSKLVARNIFVSESSMRMCLDTGLQLTNSVIIANGIDTEQYAPIDKDRSLAKKLGLDDDTFVFGSCAGTMPYKRVDTIVEAASRVKAQRKFAIIALGDEGFGRELEELAGKLNVEQFIYGGFHRNIIPYISLFDVGFVLSDSVETISFAAREMMSMGKPLLSSSYSGLAENVTENVDGFLVAPGNVEEIAAAMQKFLSMDPSQLREFSLKAREKAVARFGNNLMIQLHARVYEELAGS